MRLNALLFAALTSVFPGSALLAAEKAPDTAKLSQRLAQIMPGTKAEISPSPIPGYSEVVLGPQLVYMSNDGRYLLKGQLVDLDMEENLTETRRSAAVIKALDALGEDQMIIFGDKDAKYSITVFTDIDCGYCRKLHNEMAGYKKAGIKVRYLFFPRSGLNTPSYDKAVAVWCAKDRQKALTDAKNGKSIEMKKCDNPVAAHLELGQMMGISGTPAMILPDGELLPGYVPADRLKQFLESKATETAKATN
jgi:thiol:disulfide interchange protein DsbC